MNPFADFGITFANPWLLALLLLIPVLAFLRGQFGGSATVVFSTTHVLRSLGREALNRSGNFLNSLLYLALACLIVALARPQKGKTLSTVEASGIDIMLVLDVSDSMLAEDFHIGGRRANRLDVVKNVTEEFIAKRPNDRIGIVAFSGRPYLVSPLTLDHNWLIANLDRVTTDTVSEEGTAIGTAIASGANRLRGDTAAKSRVLILLTDGDNNVGSVDPNTTAEAARATGIKIYTVGVGTKGDVPFPAKDAFGQTVYIRHRFPLNDAALQKIAEIGNGQYYRAMDTQSLGAIYDQIDKLEKTTFEMKKYSQYRDLFPWFAGAGVALLVLQIALSQTIWRKLP